MSLIEQIDQNFTQAMKDHHQEKLDTLRMLRAALKNEEIALGHPLDEQAVIKVLGRLTKQRSEAIEQYRLNNREEAAQKEERERAILEEYLPEQLTDQELETIVKEVLAGSGGLSNQDFGKVMGPVMTRIQGRADGTRVADIVKRQLTK